MLVGQGWIRAHSRTLAPREQGETWKVLAVGLRCCWPWYGRAGNSVFPPFSLIPGHFVAVEMFPVVVFAAGEGAFDRLRMSGLALTLRPLSPREEAEVWRVLAVGIL